MRNAWAMGLCFGLAALLACDGERDGVDRDLATYIDGIKAIDVHAHPLRYVATGAAKDSEFDALPLDGIPPFQVPLGLRAEDARYRAAQHALFNVSTTDTGAAFAKSLADARARRCEHTATSSRPGRWIRRASTSCSRIAS